MRASEVIQQYQNGERNFQRQNLRGANFKGQDLRGADFSGCRIQGANFSKANLTGAKFNQVKAGLQKRWVIILLLVAFILIVLASFFSAFAGALIFALIFNDNSNPNVKLAYIILGWTGLTVLVSFCIVSYFKNLQGWLIAFTFAFFMIFPSTIVIAFDFTFAFFMVSVIATPIVVAFLTVVVFAMPIAFAMPIVFTLVFAMPIAFAIPIVITFDQDLKAKQVFLVVGLNIMLTFFGFYMGYLTIKEENRDPWLRKIAVAFASIGGTSFYGATLTDTDFTGAVLKNTNFNKAILTRTCFKDTVKLNLARAGKTIIANIQVRDLLINPSSGSNQDFAKVDLRGAYLNGANLEKSNFKQGNLREASFQYANLAHVNLTEVNAIDTDFSHATLTGATLEAWNIDQDTNLDNVECEYVYLLEKPNRKGNRERRPHDPDAIFKEGDFTRLYQKALNTLELFLRNGMNPQAFRQAFDKIMEDNPEITYDSIQSMEKKGKDVLVTVAVDEDTDKGKVEKQFNQTYTQAQLELAKTEGKLEQANQDLEKIIKNLPPHYNFPDAEFDGGFAGRDYKGDVDNIKQNHSGEGDNVGNDKTD